MSKNLTGDERAICKEVLLRCDAFKNDRYLRAIFDVQYLYPYKNGLGEFGDPTERILGTIAYLQEKSSSGKSLLIIFLEELKSLNKEDRLLCRDLDKCIDLVAGDQSDYSGYGRQLAQDRPQKDCSKDCSTPIPIPFVIAAMTQEEARELLSGKTLNDDNARIDDREVFEKVRRILETYEIKNLEDRYGAQREDWKPYPESEPIRQIIEESCKRINGMKKFDHIIEPHFRSSKYFEDYEYRKELKNSGVVLIMDDLSFFHPTLREDLDKIISNDRAAIIILSTLSGRSLDKPFYDLIDGAIKERLRDAHERYCTDLDYKCEICVDDLLGFKRWLTRVLPDEADYIRNKPPNQKSQKVFQGVYGDTYTASMAPIITGGAVGPEIG